MGAPYGSVFEVQKSALVRVDVKLGAPIDLSSVTLAGEGALAPAVEDTVDGAQVLDADGIASLRAQGASGADIIQALVDNSATFAGKTEFSKAKYLKKKANKCAPPVSSLPCLYVS